MAEECDEAGGEVGGSRVRHVLDCAMNLRDLIRFDKSFILEGPNLMVRRAPASLTKLASLSIEQMKVGVDRLQKRIEQLKAFDPSKVNRRRSPDVQALNAAIAETVERVFGRDTVEFHRYEQAARLDDSPSLGGETPLATIHRYLEEDKERGLALLRQAVIGLQEEIAVQQTNATGAEDVITDALRPRKVFIVHGHDDGAREAVARFLERLGFEAIILHERANQGRTVIEKVEAHGDVGFAVVLLTPDDEGCVKGDTLVPRARQNVILELGYFIGRLGRKRVCALKRGDVEIPSDFGGVV
jgi:hypothetical protein